MASHINFSPGCQNEGEGGVNGQDYEGNEAKTVSGLECQKWSEQKPHKHRFSDIGDHNFCRNPDKHKGVWCYTTDKNKRWELCDVPKCDKTLISVACRDNNDCKEVGEICQGGKCLPGCGRNEDCKEEEKCQDGSCVDICNPPNAQDGKSAPSPCGTNALCKSIKHRKECSCPPNHLGNPEVECITEKKGRL